MSPKKYWKTGSLANGLFGRRSGCSDEILVTASTVRAATSVKSGPLCRDRDDTGCDGAACADPAAGVAVACSADGMRPVSTSPAAKPAKTRRLMNAKRRATSADVDAARHAACRLGHSHREHPVAELGGD